jgi:cation transport regulator ChaB
MRGNQRHRYTQGAISSSKNIKKLDRDKEKRQDEEEPETQVHAGAISSSKNIKKLDRDKEKRQDEEEPETMGYQ